MIASFLALSLLPKTWFGGTTSEFCRFLDRNEVNDIAVDVGHIAVVPRMVFDADKPQFIPPLPPDTYDLTSKYSLRLLKGKLFPPKMFAIMHQGESFKWSVTDATVQVKVRKSAPPFRDFFSIKELLALAKSELRPPNPIFVEPIAYIRSGQMPLEQVNAVVAELIDHDIVKIGGKEQLKPRVGLLRSKILKTLQEYAGQSDSDSDPLMRLDVAVLRELPLADWDRLLNLRDGVVPVKLAPEAAKAYDRVFRAILNQDDATNKPAIQDYFRSTGPKSLELMVGNNFKVWHGFSSIIDGKRNFVMF